MSFDLKIVAGDLKIKNGNLEILTGKNKLSQDLVKIATTELGSNPLNSWYGSMISNSLIGNPLPDDISATIAQSQLQNSIEILKQLQNLQLSSGQKMTTDEQISYIKNILIERDKVDLRIVRVIINVLTRSFGTVSTSFNLQ